MKTKENNVKNTNLHNFYEEGELPFSAIVTLDPKRTAESWSDLSQDLWALQVSYFPVIFHKALKTAITTSKRLAR
jgi:hypothetical protein